MTRPAPSGSVAERVYVRIRPGWSVYDDDRRVSGGELLDVDPAVAEAWCERGWADLAARPTVRVRIRTDHALDVDADTAAHWCEMGWATRV